MSIRVGPVFLILSLTMAMMVNSSPLFDVTINFATRVGFGGLTKCNGKIGTCIDDEEEMMMDSESSRRFLGGSGRYISYGAMNKNNIPCNRRGNSYYACTGHVQANPYHRGCSRITQCSRNGH